MQTEKGFNTTTQPHDTGYSPGSGNMAGGLAGAMRFAAFARSIALSTFLLVTSAAILEKTMPEGIRPSDLFGGLHGATIAAEYRAKTSAAADYARAQAEATAAPQATWQMEQVVSETQQRAVASGLAVKSAAANIADMLCLGGMVMADNSRTTQVSNTPNLTAACGYGELLRQGMAQELANTARNNGALVAR